MQPETKPHYPFRSLPVPTQKSQPSSYWDLGELNIQYGTSSVFEEPCPVPFKDFEKKMSVANIYILQYACLSLSNTAFG